MKLFLFEYLRQVSTRWHPEGGLVIIARDKQHAVALIEQENEKYKTPPSLVTGPTIVTDDDDWADVIVYEFKGEPQPKIFVFPDAGCC